MPYQSLSQFLWTVIKPYKWHYLMMLAAPILGAFYDFANNYAIKLVVDAFSTHAIVDYHMLIWPISLFVGGQVFLDWIWRVSDVAEWRSEPYVRQAILTKVYDWVQHNPYAFFQNTQVGSITSKIKGILEGYDNFWAAMHHDFMPKVASSIILTAMLAVVNVKVCFFVAVWELCFFIIMYRFSKKLNNLAYQYANSQHTLLGLIADNIANIFTLFSFSTRKTELKNLNRLIEEEFIPTNIILYKYSFLSNVIAGILYSVMLISLFLFMIHLHKTAQASTGDLVFIMGTAIKMSSELWKLIHKMQDFMRNIGNFKSAFELMKTPQQTRLSNLK